MAARHYIAYAKDSRVLELPEEAQALGINPGDAVSISVDRVETFPKPIPNEKALNALREIAKRQEGRRHTDGSQTERIMREGRSGAMYGSDSVE